MTEPSSERRRRSTTPKLWEYALFVVLPGLAVLFFGVRIVAGISRPLDWIGLVLDGVILFAGARYVLAARTSASRET
ncbi:MAG TPA: hypothetical protein VJ831_03235 [Jatrophihabitantaceae bacterium]|nr:hypothetical protein [Jatrophihabitantaceae bacterium]